MIYIHVTGGVVDDRIIFDGAMPLDWPDYANWIQNDTAQIGWSYVGGVFTAPPMPPPMSTPPPTPQMSLMFDHENRLRTIEGDPPLTLEDFITTKMS